MGKNILMRAYSFFSKKVCHLRMIVAFTARAEAGNSRRIPISRANFGGVLFSSTLGVSLPCSLKMVKHYNGARLRPHQVIIVFKSYTNLSWNISLPDGTMREMGTRLTSQNIFVLKQEFLVLIEMGWSMFNPLALPVHFLDIYCSMSIVSVMTIVNVLIQYYSHFGYFYLIRLRLNTT